MASPAAERIPVIIGVGEYTERPARSDDSLEPRDMMAKALNIANEDCGGAALAQLDKLNVIMPMSWKYSDLAGRLCETLKITPQQASLGPSGGQLPLHYLHEAAKDISEGRIEVAAIIGGEAQYSLVSAQRAGQMPPWTPFASDGPNWAEAPRAIHPLSMAMGLYLPLNIYPLFEAATAAHWGQTPEQADRETGQILSISSHIAANNIMSWGPGANEPADFLARANYYESPAQEAVLNALKTADSATEAAELYSCFPVVQKMARRILGRSVETPSTVTGGMSFFGAPLNNYMTHATCAMVRRIRGGEIGGLLYGQGEFVTKHYGLRLSKTVQDPELLFAHAATQSAAETFAIPSNRDGSPSHGIIMARMESGARTLARVDGRETAILAQLMDKSRYAIGDKGRVVKAEKGPSTWQPA